MPRPAGSKICVFLLSARKKAPERKKPGSCDPGMQLVVARIIRDSLGADARTASEPLSCRVCRLAYRGREFDHLAALFRGEPFHSLVKTCRNVELNHLRHSHPPIHPPADPTFLYSHREGRPLQLPS